MRVEWRGPSRPPGDDTVPADRPITLRDLLTLMIIISDNTATHMLQELVGSANITATMRRLGLADIHVALSLPELFAHGFGLNLAPLPDYAAMVARAKDYITAGDIFQVVLAQRYTCPFPLPPLSGGVVAACCGGGGASMGLDLGGGGVETQ